jgi:glycosyltransferase involved in cell wall biosynthesis
MAKKYTDILEKATRGFLDFQNWSPRKKSVPAETLRVTGPYRGITGHDNAVRSIVRALTKAGAQIELHDLPGWTPTKLPVATDEKIFEQFRRRLPARVHLHFCMPPQVRPSARCLNINDTMFEATRLSPSWIEASLKSDLIVVPTKSSQRCWLESGMPEKKVKLCPRGVDFDLFSPDARPFAATTSDGKSVSQFRLRFLNVAESIYRKNLAGLLRAWISATNFQDDAVLILKIGFYAPGSREKFEQQLRALEKNPGKKLSEAAPIVFLDSFLTPEEMPGLYAMATHYWSMSRGEGFDLPMLEAAASGLQLIAPDHSAYQEYLNPQIAHLLPAREVPANIPDDAALNAFFAGANWWEPDENVAVELIRGLVNGSIAPTQSARAALLGKYSWDNVARRLLEIIERL